MLLTLFAPLIAPKYTQQALCWRESVCETLELCECLSQYTTYYYSQLLFCNKASFVVGECNPNWELLKILSFFAWHSKLHIKRTRRRLSRRAGEQIRTALAQRTYTSGIREQRGSNRKGGSKEWRSEECDPKQAFGSFSNFTTWSKRPWSIINIILCRIKHHILFFSASRARPKWERWGF